MEQVVESLRQELNAMKTVTEAEITKLRDRALAAEAQVVQLTQAANTQGATAVATTVAEALKEGFKNLKTGDQKNVVDTKGIGKPFTFQGEESKFQ